MKRKNLNKKQSSLVGIVNYQQKYYPELIVRVSGRGYYNKLSEIIRQFLKSLNNIPFKDEDTFTALYYNAGLVQDNWKQFKEFLTNLKQ